MEITDFILKYGTRSNVYDGKTCKPINQFSFKMVKITLPELLKNGQYSKIVKKLLKIKVDKESQELLNFILWVKDQLEEIAKQEENTLNSIPEPEMIQAGIHKLNQFGVIGTLQSLSNNVLDWKKILTLSYLDVYYKLLINKISNEIQKDYHNIMAEKAKQKR